MLRGIRGATTVEQNTTDEIINGVKELLAAIVAENKVVPEDIGAVIFSSTPDLNTAFPAAGARAFGWQGVPLFGTQEIDNPDGLPRCIRVLILWNTDLPQTAIKQVYLREAVRLKAIIANK